MPGDVTAGDRVGEGGHTFNTDSSTAVALALPNPVRCSIFMIGSKAQDI